MRYNLLHPPSQQKTADTLKTEAQRCYETPVHLLRTTRCHILENWILQSTDSRHRHVTLSRQQTTVRNLCHFRTSQLYECEVSVFQDVIWLNSVTFQTTKQKPTLLCRNGGTAVTQWLRWFDPSWCHWIFHWHKILPIALSPRGRLSL